MKKMGGIRLFAAVLCAAGMARADTEFLGGDLLVSTNWSNGLPFDGAFSQDCEINVDGFATGMNQVDPWLTGLTATVGGGCTLNFNQKPSVNGGTMIVNDATIISSDDIFAQGGKLILNAGSAVSCNDDFEANNGQGHIEINGGTHNSGSGTGSNVGAQGSDTKVGCKFDMFGGTITAGNFRFQINSISSIGGSAVLESAGSGTTFSDAAGTIDIASDWTGWWTVASFGPGDWEALVTDPANGFEQNGFSILAADFAANFAVVNGGTTLVDIETAKSLPMFTDDPVVKADALLGADYALKAQTLSGSATNANGGTMSYEKVDGLEWLVVAPSGDLSGTPTASGTNEFTVSASSGAYSSTATLRIYVEPLGNPPEFTTNFIVKADGVSGEDYALQSQSLENSAMDLDGDTLTYSKVGGDAWLNVAPDGALSGVCDTLGTNLFTVMVEDEVGNADTATLQIFVPVPSGGTFFLGGELTTNVNWSAGLPSDILPGIISTNGSYTGRNQALLWVGPGSLVTVNNGAVLTLSADFAVSQAIWTITNATIDCDDDFFVNVGTVYLEEGSVTTAKDDWEANLAGHIIVNGGTHTSGLDPTGSSQIGSQRPGCSIDFLGGTVSGVDFRFNAGSTNTIGGGAVLIGSGTLSGAAGAIDFQPGWWGSWTLDAFFSGSWQAALTDTENGFTFNGSPIDATVFSERFIVSEDGKTLTMTGDAAPVTLELGRPVGGTIGLSFSGNPGITYLIQTNINLPFSSDWGTWMTTNANGAITIDLPTSAGQNFYRVLSE